MTSISIKRLTIVHGFRPETENFDFGGGGGGGGGRRIPSERAYQEEQNDLSFVGPSSDEYQDHKK